MVLADHDFDIDAEVVRRSEYLDDAPDWRTLAVAVFQEFGVHDHAVELADIGDFDRLRPDAVHLSISGGGRVGDGQILGNFDPLRQPFIMRDHE